MMIRLVHWVSLNHPCIIRNKMSGSLIPPNHGVYFQASIVNSNLLVLSKPIYSNPSFFQIKQLSSKAVSAIETSFPYQNHISEYHIPSILRTGCTSTTAHSNIQPPIKTNIILSRSLNLKEELQNKYSLFERDPWCCWDVYLIAPTIMFMAQITLTNGFRNIWEYHLVVKRPVDQSSTHRSCAIHKHCTFGQLHAERQRHNYDQISLSRLIIKMLMQQSFPRENWRV